MPHNGFDDRPLIGGTLDWQLDNQETTTIDVAPCRARHAVSIALLIY